MAPPAQADPSIHQASPQALVLAGSWTVLRSAGIGAQLQGLQMPAGKAVTVEASALTGLDTAGAWLLHQWLLRLRAQGGTVQWQGLAPRFARLLARVDTQADPPADPAAPRPPARPALLARVGRSTLDAFGEAAGLLAFLGESALVLLASLRHPSRLRWRPVLFNIRSAGFDALPIVGLLSFLLGIVVAYQGADQLRRYGANIFVADLVGLSMLREFAPLITAIIIAGRSGSAYAAQIGTMAVTEEIDALRTLGIAPIELLVLPKLMALVIAMPLLTVFADMLGVVGGMLMARAQLGVSFAEFADRFAKAVSITAYLVGVGKAPVFAAIIAMVGCFQGFRTAGGADQVGRQTTKSVVQAIFLVIVADALFSIAFSALDL